MHYREHSPCFTQAFKSLPPSFLSKVSVLWVCDSLFSLLAFVLVDFVDELALQVVFVAFVDVGSIVRRMGTLHVDSGGIRQCSRYSGL